MRLPKTPWRTSLLALTAVACTTAVEPPLEPPLRYNCIWSSPDGTTAYVGPCDRRAEEQR